MRIGFSIFSRREGRFIKGSFEGASPLQNRYFPLSFRGEGDKGDEVIECIDTGSGLVLASLPIEFKDFMQWKFQ